MSIGGWAWDWIWYYLAVNTATSLRWENIFVVLFIHVTEVFLAAWAVTAMSGRRHPGKRQYLLGLLACLLPAAVHVFPDLIAGNFPEFALLLFLPLSAALTSGLYAGGTFLHRMASSHLAYMGIFAFNALLDLAVQQANQWIQPLNPGALFPWPDYLRRLEDLLVLVLLTVLCFFLRRQLPKLRELSRRMDWVLFLIGFFAYFAVLWMILNVTESAYIPFAIRRSVGLFLGAFVALAVGILLVFSYFERERRTNDLLYTANALMTRNYQELHADKVDYMKKLHDFNHHLNAIRELSQDGKGGEIGPYIDTLLSTSYRSVTISRCGTDIIDAIINCKAAQARELGIFFRYSIDFPEKTGINPVDICAVLANQIDNAFDACQKLEDPEDRRVEVHIWQQTGEMGFFQVTNTTAGNPFRGKGELVSTKRDDSPLHGMGIRSIRDTARKYSGDVRHVYEDGRFTSTVFLCYHSPE